MEKKYNLSDIFSKENYKSPELRKDIIEKILNKTIRKRSLLLKMNKHFIGTFSMFLIVIIGVFYYFNMNTSNQQESFNNVNNVANKELSTNSIENKNNIEKKDIEGQDEEQNKVRTLSMPTKNDSTSKDTSDGMNTMSTKDTKEINDTKYKKNKKESELEEEKIGTTSIKTNQEKNQNTSFFRKLWQDIKDIFSNLF